MITKAEQRGGGRQLATHISNVQDNELVERVDVRGFIADDPHGAFAEADALSRSTKCEKYLYHLKISPDWRKYDLTRAQYFDFIQRIETRLNLTNQPRFIMRHVKDGREHWHIIYCRIIPEKNKALQISHDRLTRRAVTKEFAKAHGLELPAGYERKPPARDLAKRRTLAEEQQEKRTGLTKEDHMAAMLRAWRNSRDGHEFAANIEKEGYVLANGKEDGKKGGRAYLIVDPAGEYHSLTRQLSGAVKAKEVQARLVNTHEKLPSIDEARALIRERGRERDRLDRERKIMAKADDQRERQIMARRTALAEKQQTRRGKLAAERTDLAGRMTQEKQALLDLHRAHDRGVMETRKPPGRIMAFLARITGIQAYVEGKRAREDSVRAQIHARQLQALDDRHGREKRELHRLDRALKAVETRERQSLEQTIRREDFQRSLRERGITPEFIRAAEPAREQDRQDGDGKGLFNKIAALFKAPEKEAVPVREEFAVQAKPSITLDKGALSEAFRRRAADKERETGDEGRTRTPRGPERGR